MSIVIDAPKLLPVRLVTLTPKDMKNNFVYTYDATIDVTAQLHSGTVGFTPSQYDGRDVKVGDYIATSSSGKVLKVSQLTSVGPTRIVAVLVDEDQLNSAVDPTQYGESAIDTDDGILFETREGKPYIFPLPDILPGGLTNEFAIQIASRFNFSGKERNITVEQAPHNFELGELVTLDSSGWLSDVTSPTGVIVKADDDSFSVRLFGVKTHMELPGNVGDIYYWDSVDRMLTTTPGANVGTKLFQKLDSREALLLNTSEASASGGSGGGGDFSGNYNDLVNKPIIPTDVSGLTDTTNLIPDVSGLVTSAQLTTAIDEIEHPNTFSGNYNDLTNTPTLFSGSYTDLTDKPSVFDGNYNALYNAPVIPTNVSDLTNDSGFLTTVTMSHVLTALGYTPANVANIFSGDYNSLANLPVLSGYQTAADVSAAVANFITEAEIDAKIVAAGSGNVDLSNYSTTAQIQALINAIPSTDLTNYSTTPEIQALIDALPSTDLSDYSTTVQVQALIDAIPSGGVSSWNDLTDKPTLFNGNYSSLTGTPTIPDTSLFISEAEIDAKIVASAGGNVDLSNYSTTAQMNAAISAGAGTTTLDGLSDVAIGSIETDNHVLMYNALNSLWENADLEETFATKAYVTNTIATQITDGDFDLEGYATTSYVTQALLERGHHFSGSYLDLNNKPNLFSGNYNDLTNIPSLKEYSLTSSGSTLNLIETVSNPDVVVASIDFASLGVGFSGNYNDLTNTPTLFNGNYDQLANKPYIPSIADLATETYVENKWAEPVIPGDRTFTHDVEVQGISNQKTSIVSHVANQRNMVMAIQTTDAVDKEVLFSDSSRIDMEIGTTAKFTATYVSTSGADHCSFVINGIIHRSSSDITLIGDNNRVTTADTGQGWTGSLSADSTNNSLKVTVQGSAATTVDWTIFVEITEVIT